MTKQFKECECCNPNYFEKTEAGGLFFFWSSLQNVILKHLPAINFTYCYKLAVIFPFQIIAKMFLPLVYNGWLYVIGFVFHKTGIYNVLGAVRKITDKVDLKNERKKLKKIGREFL